MALILNGQANTIGGLAAGGLPDDSVALADLSATGTASASTFLRGDNAWAAVPAGGITEADLWRLTTSFTGDSEPISSNWERNDRAGEGVLGTGMSQSSGIFTFPSTGWWNITFTAQFFHSSDSRYCSTTIQTTVDNGSNWLTVAETSDSIYHISGGANAYANPTCTTNLDVTDVGQCKVKFNIGVEDNGSYTLGSTNVNHTFATFTRLGDT